MNPNVTKAPEANQPNVYNAPALAPGEPLLKSPLQRYLFLGGLAVFGIGFFLIGFLHT